MRIIDVNKWEVPQDLTTKKEIFYAFRKKHKGDYIRLSDGKHVPAIDIIDGFRAKFLYDRGWVEAIPFEGALMSITLYAYKKNLR